MLRTRILPSHLHPHLHWQAGVTWSLLTAALLALLAIALLVTPRAALAAPGSEEYTAPGTHVFTVPQGVTALTVELWGGGGGGAGGSPHADDELTLSGGGGGGGEYAGVTIDVWGGMVFEIAVGERGIAGIPGGAGGAGGDSSITELAGEERTLTAHGGLGGLANGAGGAAGTGAAGVGVVAHAGGAGGGGGNSDDDGKPRIGGGGGGGAAGPDGAGAAGTVGNCFGPDGCSSPTGGGGGNAGAGLLAPLGTGGTGAGVSAAQSGRSPGGGGGGGSSTTALAGAAGGFGQVRISWDSVAASEAESTITATPAQVAADGEAMTKIKVIARDAEGEPIHGALVTLEAGPSSGLTVVPDVGVYTNSLGEATFTATRTANGLVVFTATISTFGNPGVELEASVQFGEGEDGEGCADPLVPVGQFSPGLQPSGITIATWGGGHVALFPDATSFWTTHDGALMGYIPGAPDFVNQGFINVFTKELPACMPLIVRT